MSFLTTCGFRRQFRVSLAGRRDAGHEPILSFIAEMDLSEILGLLRFGAGLRRFVREPLSVEAAEAVVQRGMQRRDQAFLGKVEHAIFGYARSPYRALFRHVGCELGDVRKLVQQDGVEGALERLRDNGVYVTFEEFKGLAPAVRGSVSFSFRAEDFDNPLATRHFRGSTGGSSGRLTRIRFDLDHVGQTAPHWALWFAAHGWLAADRPLVVWWPGHAGAANGHLLALKAGKPYTKWFVQVRPEALRDRIGAALIHGLVRRASGLTKPEFAPAHAAERVGAYLTGLIQQGLRPCVNTSPSQAIRVCRAVAQRGHTLDGVTFWLGAEPTTPTRRRAIEDHGAVAVPLYGFSEGGNVGNQCPNGTDDDVHISLDAYALIQRRRTVRDQELVDALLFTALRPACPKVLLNTEIGDYGVLETRRCGCVFDDFGYTRHVHTIRSFDKLTGEGMTFVGADLFNLMEAVLPQRFGGAAGDYQLVEEQDAEGLARYALLVSPEVGTVDDSEVIAVFLDGLAAKRKHYRYMATAWRDASLLRVERQRPIVTGRGKVFPFRTLGLS